MKLSIELQGNLDRVVVSSMPRAFIARIFRHCMGKNNTPYFANNCFKGVLYFDEELARKYALMEGYDYKGWHAEDKFYRGRGFNLPSLDIMAYPGGQKERKVDPGEIVVAATPLSQDALLSKLGDDEALILLGSVDTGSETYVLDGFEGDFDPEKLSVTVDTFDAFGLEERLVTGMAYAGQAMERIPGKSVGKNMIDPALFAKNGRELTMDDFRVMPE